MWDYLTKIYNQENVGRNFHFELELSQYSQGNKSIQEYHSEFVNLWTEFIALVYAKVPDEAPAAIQKVYNDSQRDQFLIKLHKDFGPVWSSVNV